MSCSTLLESVLLGSRLESYKEEERGAVRRAMYRVTSPIGNYRPLGPYSTTMPRALWGSYADGRFLMSEVPM